MRREKLYREWEHMSTLGLHVIKEFFRSGRDGDAIPETFRARLDQHSRHLNNFSATFWLKPKTSK